MWWRWGAVVIGGLIAAGYDENAWGGWFWWFGAIAVFFATPQVAYRIYRRKDRARAEIVFHNEEDGFCSGDEDGDGDGGD